MLVREQELPHWEHEALAQLHVATLADARAAPEPFDVAVATWWETTSSLFLVPAGRYAYFVQSLEDRFYHPAEVEATYAGLTYDLPVAFITEAPGSPRRCATCAPTRRCHLVRNGIDKGVFPVADEVVPNVDGPLRVLVEGYANVWFKGVNAAIAAVRAMGEPHELTVVAPSRTGLEADGATRVARRGAPARAGRAVRRARRRAQALVGRGDVRAAARGLPQGATCVTTEVTGHEEYVEHGYNALVVRLGRHRAGRPASSTCSPATGVLLHRLRCGALETARRWPTWEQQGAVHGRRAASGSGASRRPTRRRRRGCWSPTCAARWSASARTWPSGRSSQVLRDKVDRVKALPGVGEAVALRRTRRGRQALRVARAVARRVRPAAARARSLPGRLRG